MQSFDLEPTYSTNEISGKCLKCLSEHELNSCLMQLLGEDGISEEVRIKYEALVTFLQSSESKQLRVESERYLAEGKRVSVRITLDQGKPKYELIVDQEIVKATKIAVISDDGFTVSRHFGRASLYVIATISRGIVVNKENREKEGHQSFSSCQHPETPPGERHGYDAGPRSRHAAMAQSIDDCQVLIAGGMGWGAYESLKSRGFGVIVTDVVDIDEAIRLYLEGKLLNLMERLH